LISNCTQPPNHIITAFIEKKLTNVKALIKALTNIDITCLSIVDAFPGGVNATSFLWCFDSPCLVTAQQEQHLVHEKPHCLSPKVLYREIAEENEKNGNPDTCGK